VHIENHLAPFWAEVLTAAASPMPLLAQLITIAFDTTFSILTVLLVKLI